MTWAPTQYAAGAPLWRRAALPIWVFLGIIAWPGVGHGTGGSALVPTTLASGLPRGFVYLRDFDATILQDIRYAGRNNFLGRPVPGYQAAECILLAKAARRLALVQADLRAKGLSLKVYDCYRPLRSARAFIAWTRRPVTTRRERALARRFHPDVARRDLIYDGYISARSTHPQGATVDVTLVSLRAAGPGLAANLSPRSRFGACTGPVERRAPDNGIDMGTGYDCFDKKSHTLSRAITPAQRQRRAALLKVMAAHGFRNYRREWWHFTLAGAPRTAPFHNFVIRPRPDPPLPTRAGAGPTD